MNVKQYLIAVNFKASLYFYRDLYYMRPFKSAIKTSKASYKQNYAEMEKLVGELHQQLKNSQTQGTEASIARARKRGKFLALSLIHI